MGIYNMQYDKYTCEVGHPGLRRDFIGSSDASAIMGVSPWDTPLTLWETKLGLRHGKDLSYAMARGIAKEKEARDYIREKTGIDFAPTRVFSDEYPWMMGNFDGLSPCGQYAVEIKVPGAIDHAKASAGIVPEKYFPQLQHLMKLKGLKSIYYESWTENYPVIIIVEADPEYQSRLIEKEKEFYECIRDFREPKKIEADISKRNDPCWRDAAQKYIGLSSMKKQLDEQVEEARNELLLLAGDQSSEGCGVKVTKSSRKGNVQYAKIPELQHIDLDYYRSPPTESWRILTSGDENAE